MAALFEKLPTILVLAVLVGIFVSLRRHVKSVRIHLWIAAWGLILLHFIAQVFEVKTGPIGNLIAIVDLGALQLAGVVFIVSLTVLGEVRQRRIILLVLLTVPI